MARKSSSKKSSAELGPVTDPTAPLDVAAFLAAAKPVLKLLAEDLAARAKAEGVRLALEAQYAAEKEARRTAESFEIWRAALLALIAAAWVLSCVFVRTLEDRGLIDQRRLAGPGAEDSQKIFLELAPSLSERDYLLLVFRELTRLPAAEGLFDARHNLVWRLGPSGEAAKTLVRLFRTPSAAAPAFRFGQSDTRFLGDLYQDLDDDVRDRYALLQTPRFVERYILDRTLTRAIERFGLEATTLVDPTCGSGHFLLGAFERLFAKWQEAAPAKGVEHAARRALDQVFGADVNPYAIAIARFRLTLAYLDAVGTKSLESAPALPLHLAVADSLLHNPQLTQLELGHRAGDVSEWSGSLFSLEDPEAARDVLHREHAAVVGNPPYITVKDAARREEYRKAYAAAAGKYSLAAPFAERFFQLAERGGAVGMITANSFMKREFGKKLIQDCLPKWNLDGIVNTSGAYIPGHGTPTVLLFGTNEPPKGNHLLAVLAKRGEPSTPDDPEEGLVWRSIADHGGELGFENEYVSVARVERLTLEKHPWSLGGGGAAELKELLEERADKRLGDIAEDIGFASFTGLDDVFILPRSAACTHGLEEEVLRPMIVGENVRDWTADTGEVALAAYSKETQHPLPLLADSKWGRFLWPYRTTANNVSSFGGKTREEEGQNWWEWYRWVPDRYHAKFRIAFAFVATHNHFVLDRGGKVFNRSAPIIKLPATATEEDHLALLAYLNSSTACFWMKQVCHDKTNHTDDRPETFEPGTLYYEFAGTAISPCPIPSRDAFAALAAHAQRLEGVLRDAAWTDPAEVADSILAGAGSPEDIVVRSEGAANAALWHLVALQEDLDWFVYGLFGLCDPRAADPIFDEGGMLRPEDRLFLGANEPPGLTGSRLARWRLRASSIHEPQLCLVETAECKRRWIGVGRGSFAREARTHRERCRDALVNQYLGRFEALLAASPTVLAARTPTDFGRGGKQDDEILRWLAGAADPGPWLRDAAHAAAVPYLAAFRYTPQKGMEKRSAWERIWELQRREDSGDDVGTISVPPKYGRDDYREPRYFKIRGKLDVPKERFISYPGCESDESKDPIYGWAGWNHLQQVRALGGLYKQRKDDGWKKDRLTPMLAGILELLPWVKQWHNEPSADFDGVRLGDYFENYLDKECLELGLTRDDLRAWRPQTQERAKARAKAEANIRGEAKPKTEKRPKAENKPKAPRKASRAKPRAGEA